VGAGANLRTIMALAKFDEGQGSYMTDDPPTVASQVAPKTIKAECPYCGGPRKTYVKGCHQKSDNSDDDDGTSASVTAMILECGGCEGIFFRRDYWFSEWETIGQHPVTGEPRMEGGTETTYWPPLVERTPPKWIIDVEMADQTLGNILSEMYTALNNDLRVLAAIGARTAFDRSSELLGVDATLQFNQKLDQLVAIGKISAEERLTLEVLVDAGGAAAHRGWKPKPKDVSTMMDVVEAFLYRGFILGDGIQKLKAAVPPRNARAKPLPR
jgi:hypothetical protein